MIVRYKINNAKLKARLDQGVDASGARVPRLVVRYGGEVIEVRHLEARQDCELVSATRQELEQLRAARYEVPLAADFNGSMKRHPARP